MNIKKITKKDGTIKYRTNVYLGIDSLTGKKVQTTATATTRKMCEIKANQAISNFIKNGSFTGISSFICGKIVTYK